MNSLNGVSLFLLFVFVGFIIMLVVACGNMKDNSEDEDVTKYIKDLNLKSTSYEESLPCLPYLSNLYGKKE